MPVVITTPPPRMRPSFAASARLAAQRAWSARLAWVRRARSVLPQAKKLGNQAAQWLPSAKKFGTRAARLLPNGKRLLTNTKRLLPNAKRLLPPVKRVVPQATRWARRTVNATPRAVLVTAPIVALFAIWLVHGIATRHRHPSQAVALAASPALRTTLLTQAAASQPVAAPLAAVATGAESSAARVEPIAAEIITPALTATANPPPLADDSELRAALAQGLPAMEGLAAKYTADPQVLVTLASAQAQAQRYDAAIETIDRALDSAPNTAQNGKIMGILWRAAQSPAGEEAFACLRKLGGRGSDVELDLATTPGVRDVVRERAKTELASHLALDASSDTRAATALLLAPDCATRQSLLERAERDGGKRTLALLERFSRGAGCTSGSDGSCNACLAGSAALQDAIAKLSAGVKQ
jgi:tetratricopeptide (TPR) repeat protein